ncbi:hypothetical protein FNYG_03806 [Fusarium nygamai]|uniref:Uncharacterized protein n=1 Tax=Gibberella nygamai TaxID=42673 RepID=A0A2K0WKX4_GIBNY|nr:hypothetical protein FNYG_03806 [Fusarium nygamai]
MRIGALSLIALALGTGAVPVSENSVSELGKRCTWDDGHGPIDCSFFSIVFGANGNDRNHFVIKANNFEQQDYMPCKIFQYDSYDSYNSPLPWVLMLAPGNTCAVATPGAWWDGLHIKYASTFLNTPTDTRCGPVDNGWGRRCIISQRP